MRVSVFGLGYVGIVSAACLAAQGHKVLGVDTNSKKVQSVNEGKAPIVEQDIGGLVERTVGEGVLSATDDGLKAVLESELVLVAVGTPSLENGEIDLTYLKRVCQQIGQALSTKSGFTTIAIRSTVAPGTMRGLVLPMLQESSGKTAGADFGVGFYPEFLREGSAVSDFYHPARVVIAATDEISRERLLETVQGIEAGRFIVDFETAELVKYADNAWHATKVAFANEIGTFCKAARVDSRTLMDIFCQDTKLNISPKYLIPGPPFGGSCLPKDLRALTYVARTRDLELPLINAVLDSNDRHLDRIIRLVIGQGRKQVGLLGLSFKAGTDDLRESPMVNLAERLIGKGFDVAIYDPDVSLSKLLGANEAFILKHLPHLSKLLVSEPSQLLNDARTVVIGHYDDRYDKIIQALPRETYIIDLVGVDDCLKETRQGNYYGLCW